MHSIRAPLAIGRFGAPGVSTPHATQIILCQVKNHIHPHMFCQYKKLNNCHLGNHVYVCASKNEQVEEETGEVVVAIVPIVGR